MASNYKIASGHNNAAGLIDITSITPSGDIAFYPPQAWSRYFPGRLRVRADGSWYETGFASTLWKFSIMTNAQLDYLYDNYANDSTNGNKVTIATPGRDGSVFANYSANIILPVRSEQRIERVAPLLPFQDIEIKFIRLEAL